jgi:hypothetical protein
MVRGVIAVLAAVPRVLVRLVSTGATVVDAPA